MLPFSPPVRPEKVRELVDRMLSLGIREEDLVERFIRSSGPGGQKVNKTSTCVYIKHIPTGVEVKCRESRSQALNRFLARRYLVEKIEAMRLGLDSEREKLRQKLRKQKQKRRKRAKMKYGSKG